MADNYFCNALSAFANHFKWARGPCDTEAVCKKELILYLRRGNECFLRTGGKYSFGLSSDAPYDPSGKTNHCWFIYMFAKQYDLAEIEEFRQKIVASPDEFYGMLLDEYKAGNVEVCKKTIHESQRDAFSMKLDKSKQPGDF